MLHIKQAYTIFVLIKSLKSVSPSQQRSKECYYLLVSTKTETSCTGSLIKDVFPYMPLTLPECFDPLPLQGPEHTQRMQTTHLHILFISVPACKEH